MNYPLTLRNAIVLSLTAGLAELFRLPEGLFMVLAVLLSLEGSIGQGLKAARERIVGTFCGAAVCVLLLGMLKWTGVPAATVGLSLVRVMGHGLGLSSGFIVGGHVVAGSVANHSSDWPTYISLRTVETLAGLLIAVLAARWILPVRASHRLEQGLGSWRTELAAALRQAGLSPARWSALRSQRDQLIDQLPFAREELLPSQAARALSARWDQQLFHGGALLSGLRELSQPGLTLPHALRRAHETLLNQAADLLDASPAGAEAEPGPADLQGLQQATSDFVELALRLSSSLCPSADAALDPLALWIHHSRLIGLHAEAMLKTAQGTRS